MDLRAPLRGVHEYCEGNGKESSGEGTAPWAPPNGDAPSASDSGFMYEGIMRHLLCRMCVASHVMELGSESRFTGMVLFHRYARRFYCLVRQNQRRQEGPMRLSTQGQRLTHQEMGQMKSHLGPVAAVCLFLGCKMEEEPRRIRDVINVSHLLSFSAWEDADAVEHTATTQQRDLERNNPVTIAESPHPPSLDESYWTAKEKLVSTEQHVLRMINFDTTVCHPHRCVLTIMETLGFGAGKNASSTADVDDAKWLLDSNQSEIIILRAWRILNEVVLDPREVALEYPVVKLSCAAIALAAGGGIKSADDGLDDGKPVALPEFWWRALDVKDIAEARESLQKVLR